MDLRRLFILPVITAASAGVLFLGYSLSAISLKTVCFIILGLSGTTILFMPFHWAFLLFFFYLGIEGFAKIMTNYNPVVHVGADLLVSVLVARVLMSSLSRTKLLPDRFPPFTLLMLIHFAWFFIAFSNPFALSIVASAAAAKMYITMPILFFFGYYLLKDIRQFHHYVTVWIVVCLLQILTSLYQSSIGPTSVTRLAPGYAVALQKFQGYAFRPFGLTSQAGAPSVYLYMTFPFIVYTFMRTHSFTNRIVQAALLISGMITLMFCQVRAAIFKAIVGVCSFMLISIRSLGRQSKRVKWSMVSFAVLFALVIIFALPRAIEKLAEGNNESQMAFERSLSLFNVGSASSARSGNVERFLLYAGMAPFGAGLSRTGAAAGKFESEIKSSPFFKNGFFSDNFWVATVVDLGIPGTIILTVLVFGILGKIGYSTIRIRNPEMLLAQNVLFATLTAIVFGFYGAESILYNPEAGFFWFFAGLAMKIPELDLENKVPVEIEERRPGLFNIPEFKPRLNKIKNA